MKRCDSANSTCLVSTAWGVADTQPIRTTKVSPQQTILHWFFEEWKATILIWRLNLEQCITASCPHPRERWWLNKWASLDKFRMIRTEPAATKWNIDMHVWIIHLYRDSSKSWSSNIRSQEQNQQSGWTNCFAEEKRLKRLANQMRVSHFFSFLPAQKAGEL